MNKIFKIIFTFSITFLITGIIFSQPPYDESLYRKFNFEPSYKVNVEVYISSLIVTNNKFFYSYRLKSKQDSIQNVWVFDIEFRDKLTSIFSAPNWLHEINYGFNEDVIRKNATRMKTIEWFTDGEGEYDITPGNLAEGFGFTSKGLPGIVSFFAQGYTKKDMAEGEFTDEEIDIIAELQDFFNNSFSGKTIGPDIIPPDITLKGLIERLISLKDESFKLGWIDNDGIANSLNKKLENAKDAINRGQNETAKNMLNAFINELEAQKGKHINDNAYYLLKTNAESLKRRVSKRN